jgi:hypothetical protein
MKCAVTVLAVAGFFALAEEPKNLLKPTNKVESWRFEEHEGGKGNIKATDDAIVFASTKVTGTDWHVQAIQTDLDLKEGQTYVLKFQAKAESFATIGVHAMIDEADWHVIGLSEQITLNKDFSPHDFTFRADGVNTKKKNRISFVLGFETCTVTIKDLTLTAK